MNIGFAGGASHSHFSIGSVGRSNTASGVKSTSASAPTEAESQSIRSRFGTDGTGINREIRVNGELIGLVFNSGVTALDNKYSELGDTLWGAGSLPDDEKELYGPELADVRTEKLMRLLGEATAGEIDASEGAFLSTLKGASFDISLAPTAMTQAEFVSWMTTRATETGRHLDVSV